MRIELTLTTSCGAVGHKCLNQSNEGMHWSEEPSGHTELARIEVFNDSDALIDAATLDGDQWRTLDDEYDLDAVVQSILDGKDVNEALAEQMGESAISGDQD